MRYVSIKKGLVLASVVLVLSCAALAFSACKERQDWALIEYNRCITIAVAEGHEPYSYTNDNGDLVGFDVDFLSVLCKKIGVKIKIVSIPWDTAEEKLKDKTVDVLWNFSRTTEREPKVLFSNCYLNDKAVAVAKKPVAKLQDILLDVKTIAVQKNSAQEDWAQNTFLTGKIFCFLTLAETMQSLEQGQADLAVVDLTYAQYYIANIATDASQKLMILESKALLDITHNAALRLTDVGLSSKLNTAIAEVCQDEVFKTLRTKWFGV